MGDKKSIVEFSKSIKDKYPQYKDMDDLELTNKILAKYPQYESSVDLKKKDQSQQDSGVPASQPTEPFVASGADIKDKLEDKSDLVDFDYKSIAKFEKDMASQGYESQSQFKEKTHGSSEYVNQQLGVIKKDISDKFPELLDLDQEAVKSNISKRIIEQTNGNEYLANRAIQYYDKLIDDQKILKTESTPTPVEEGMSPEDQERVLSNIQQYNNEQILGEKLAKELAPIKKNIPEVGAEAEEKQENFIIPESKITSDFMNYLQVENPAEYNNALEGKYSKGEKGYNFYNHALGHQMKLNDAKYESGAIDEETYNAFNNDISARFAESMQMFPEFEKEVEKTALNQEAINADYQQALIDVKDTSDPIKANKAAIKVGLYTTVLPLATGVTKFVTGTMASIGRLSVAGKSDESSRLVNNLIDDFDEYFDTEKTILRLPSELKGELITEEGFQSQKLIPKVTEMFGHIAPLLMGAGEIKLATESLVGVSTANKVGLFAATYVSSYNNNYQAIKQADPSITHEKATNYATLASAGEGAVMTINPFSRIKMAKTGDGVAPILKNLKKIDVVKENAKTIAKTQLENIRFVATGNFVTGGTNYLANKMYGTELKTDVSASEWGEAIITGGILFSAMGYKSLKSGNQLTRESFHTASKNIAKFEERLKDENITQNYTVKAISDAKKNLNNYKDLYDAVPEIHKDPVKNEEAKSKVAMGQLEKGQLGVRKAELEKLDPIIVEKEIKEIDEEIEVVDAETRKNLDKVPSKKQFVKEGIEKAKEEADIEEINVEKATELLEKKYDKLYKDVKEEKQQVPSGERKGEAPIEAKPDKETGVSETKTDRDVQAPKKEKVTTEDKKQFAIDAVKYGQVIERKLGKNANALAREDFGLSTKEINKAIVDIKKGNYETAPAKKLIEKLMEAHDKGGIPVIEGTGGKSVRSREIPLDFIKKEIEKAKKEPKEYTPEEMAEAEAAKQKEVEEKSALDKEIAKDLDKAKVQDHSKISQKITEWFGDKLPMVDIKKAIKSFAESTVKGEEKEQAINKALEEIKVTDWYLEKDSKGQEAFDSDFRKALGSKEAKAVKEKSRVIKMTERAVEKEKIKNLMRGAKIGASAKGKILKEQAQEIIDYAKETLGGLEITNAEQRTISRAIKNLTGKNREAQLEKIDNIFSKAEERLRKKTIDEIKKFGKNKKTIFKKKGSKWVAKIPVKEQLFLDNFFETKTFDNLSAKEALETLEMLKDIQATGVAEVKAMERVTRANNRREKGEVFKGILETSKEKPLVLEGLEAVKEAFGEKSKVIAMIEGEMIESQTALKEFIEMNPDADFSRVEMYERKTSSIQQYNRTNFDGGWLHPLNAKRNLKNTMIPIFKKSPTLKKVMDGLLKDVKHADFMYGEDSGKKIRDYTNKVAEIFSKGSKFNIGKKFHALNRLGATSGIFPTKEFKRPVNNSVIANIYGLSKTKTGLKGLKDSKMTDSDLKNVEDYMNMPENKDLKEYADYLLNEFYPSLRPEYEPTYTHITGAPFPKGKYYPAEASRDVKETIDVENIIDKEGTADYMSAVSGHLKEKVDHTHGVNLTIGAHDVATNYIKSMERAKHFIPVGEKVNNIFSPANRAEMVSKVGNKDVVDLTDHLSVVVTGVDPRKGRKGDLDKVINVAATLKIYGALLWKMASTPKQLTSATHFSRTEGVGTRKWLGGMAPKTKGEINFAKDLWASIYKKDTPFIYAQTRMKGGLQDIEVSRVIDPTGLKRGKRILTGATKAGMGFITAGDIGGVMLGGVPLAVAKYRENIKNNMSDADARADAYETFVNASESQQQSKRASETSHMQRHNVGRLFSMFTTSQTQTTNKLIGAAQTLIANPKLTFKEKSALVKDMLYYSVANVAFASIASGAINEVAGYLFQDGDVEEAEKALYDIGMDNVQSTLNGIGLAGTIANMTINNVRDRKWMNEIPLSQELGNIAEGLSESFIYAMEDRKGLSEKEVEKVNKKLIHGLMKLISMGSMEKQIQSFEDAAKGDKELKDAIMNWKSDKEKREEKPKNDKFYKYLFDKDYSKKSSRGRSSRSSRGYR